MSFGAKAVFEVPQGEIGMDGRGATFMILLDDGWHYAHRNTNSIYAAAEAFTATSGWIAWLHFVQKLAAKRKEQAERDLAQCYAYCDEVQNELAQAVKKGKR